VAIENFLVLNELYHPRNKHQIHDILCRNVFPPIDPAAGVSLQGAGFALAAAVTVAISTYAMSANEL